MGRQIYIFAIFVAVIFLARQLMRYLSVRRITRKHGFKPPNHLPQLDRIFGFDLFRVQAEAVKNKRLLAMAKERYDNYGNTWSFMLMGARFCEIVPVPNLLEVTYRAFQIVPSRSRMS